MKKRKDISIRDIAKEAGCSTATVSRVINHQGGYSRELEETVLEIINRHRYKTGNVSKPVIGILVPDLRNEFMTEEVVALEELLRQRGIYTSVSSTNEDSEQENFCMQGLSAGKAAAVISFQANDNVTALARKMPMPVLFMDRVPEDKSGVIAVESDNYLGAYMATELLIKKGCKRILFLGWRNDIRINEARQRGYMDALRDYGMDIIPELQTELSDNRGYYDSAKDMVYYLLKRKVDFDGIFATNDVRAQGALAALQMEGIAVPEQVKLVGFDDSPVCKRCRPALTSVRQDYFGLAEKTVECLLEQLQNPHIPMEKHIVVPTSIVERGTT